MRRPYNRDGGRAKIGAAPGLDRRRWGLPTFDVVMFLGEGASESPSRSGFADRLEDRGGQRVGGRLAGPYDVLKGRVEALAFADRHFDQVVELLGLEAFGAPKRD